MFIKVTLGTGVKALIKLDSISACYPDLDTRTGCTIHLDSGAVVSVKDSYVKIAKFLRVING